MSEPTPVHGESTAATLRTFIVRYTPGPPAVGTLREESIVAASADDAVATVKARHPRWCMVHDCKEER